MLHTFVHVCGNSYFSGYILHLVFGVSSTYFVGFIVLKSGLLGYFKYSFIFLIGGLHVFSVYRLYILLWDISTQVIHISDNTSGEKTAATEPNTDIASQLKTMRQDLDALKDQKAGVHVDEALATVRTFASWPKFTSHIIIAALENLVEIANKTSYKDASLFSKSLSICKKYEENDDFCGLVLKLFSSPPPPPCGTRVRIGPTPPSCEVSKNLTE